MRLDQTDIKIIRSLSSNSRKSLMTVAEELHLSRTAVRKRISKLLKDEAISFNVGINIKKLGYETVCVGLSVKGHNEFVKLTEALKKCPRLIMMVESWEKFNLVAYFYCEDSSTGLSTVDSFRGLRTVEIVFVYRANAPLYPDTVPVKTLPKKIDSAPCGLRKCEDCSFFIEDKCLGCPAVKVYKGSLCV
ncbi:MAG: AsnC family transcriptional regulator [Candidatus Bathyarchaeota archaeon]